MGAAVFSYSFPYPFPPAKDVQLLRYPLAQECIELSADTLGRLHLAIRGGASQPELRLITQPLLIVGNGMALLSVRWDEHICQLTINRTQVRSATESSDVLIIEASEALPHPLPSIVSSQASERCQAWLSWRQRTFETAADPGSSEEHRRLLQELNEEIASLQYTLDGLLDGHAHLRRTLATILCGLFYWPDPARRHEDTRALLLRVAAQYELPLPVFGFPDHLLPTRPTTRRSPRAYISDVPTLVQLHASQELMDVQSWLARPARLPARGTVKSELVGLKMKDLLLCLSGGARRGLITAQELIARHHLRRLEMAGDARLTDILTETAGLATALGHYVLYHAAQAEIVVPHPKPYLPGASA